MTSHATAALPHAAPEEVGLCPTRLARLSARMREGVERAEIPGAILQIARRGRVAYEECFGYRDPATQAPMRADSIFRIASMTKPITSMAAMMLAEEGRLSLTDEVSQHLSEFSNLRVLDPNATITDPENLPTVPLERAMTIQDLLRHTSGLAYAFMGTHPLKQRYQALQVSDPQITNEEHVRRLSTLPLLHQPGSTWEYGVSTDVLGRVIEKVSGQSLDDFVRCRITEPLKLHDTAFHAPESQSERCAHAGPEGAARQLPNIPAVTAPALFKSGGGGMVSTASDYARLCQLWLNGGELEGQRLLSRKTLALMTSNHLSATMRFGPEMTLFGPGTPSPEYGHGFGLGFSIRTEPGLSPLPGSVGTYAWSGIYGTSFWVDPQEDLFCVLMLQSVSQRAIYRRLVQTLVYQALR